MAKRAPSGAQAVLRALPHWYRLVHETFDLSLFPAPPVNLAEAIVRYRERIGLPFDPTDPFPAYADRGHEILPQFQGSGYFPDQLRGERGDRPGLEE